MYVSDRVVQSELSCFSFLLCLLRGVKCVHTTHKNCNPILQLLLGKQFHSAVMAKRCGVKIRACQIANPLESVEASGLSALKSIVCFLVVWVFGEICRFSSFGLCFAV